MPHSELQKFACDRIKYKVGMVLRILMIIVDGGEVTSVIKKCSSMQNSCQVGYLLYLTFFHVSKLIYSSTEPTQPLFTRCKL